MVSLTQWTRVWASSGRWWRTGRPGVLQSMGSQRVGQTERLSSSNKVALALLASWLVFILCLQLWTVSSMGIHRLQSYWRRGLSLMREARRVHCSFYLGWGWGVGMWPRLGQSNVSSWLWVFVEWHKDNGIDNSSHWFNIHMGIAPSRGGQLHCLTGRWNPGCWKLSCFLSILRSWSSKFLLILSHPHGLPVNYLLIQTTRGNFHCLRSRTPIHTERLKPNPNQPWYGKTWRCLYWLFII